VVANELSLCVSVLVQCGGSGYSGQLAADLKCSV